MTRSVPVMGINRSSSLHYIFEQSLKINYRLSNPFFPYGSVILHVYWKTASDIMLSHLKPGGFGSASCIIEGWTTAHGLSVTEHLILSAVLAAMFLTLLFLLLFRHSGFAYKKYKLKGASFNITEEHIFYSIGIQKNLLQSCIYLSI